ncbi:MAG TPA: NADH-quinone oxidoreductase subunit N [Gemmatimonadaceae bacterium]|nr:NADH-quinone oxidoreductase subunit N [Gemmatimonadaceae bacterium]
MRIDLQDPRGLTFALGPDLLLIGGAMLLLLFAGWRRETTGHQRAVGIASLIVTTLTGVAVAYYATRFGDVTTLEGPIAVDNFRWLSDLVVLLATFLAILLTMEYNEREGIAAPESHVLMLFATSGMMLMAAARDLMIVFLGVEIMSVSVYVLAGLNRRSVRAAEGALKYFLLGAFSTGFLLYGIALIYGATGTTTLTAIQRHIAAYGLAESPLLLTGLALLLVGFGFKVAAAPFHMWAPDVYEGAPTPVTAYMASAVKAAAFATFLRVWIEAFPDLFARWHTAVFWLAVVTMVVGNAILLTQRNIKRFLAYSSIGHTGFLLVALAAGTDQGTEAFLFYLLAYTLATFGAFAVVIALGQPGEGDLRIEGYSGLWTERPWLAVAMAVFMLAFLGFPIFGGLGFFAKWTIIQAALEAPVRQTWLAVILVLASVVAAGGYLYVVKVLFFNERPAVVPAATRVGVLTRFTIALAAVVILVLGVWPQPLVSLVRGGAPRRPVAAATPLGPVAAGAVR